jgi:hypothetical protein
VYDGTSLRAVSVRTGVTNGTAVELLDAPIEAGAAAVSAVSIPSVSSRTVSTAAAASTTRSPLLGSSPPPPPSGGMGGPR